MIFLNSPFDILDKAFRNLYPNKEYVAYVLAEVEDEDGERAYGFTRFEEGKIPIIAISAELRIKDAIEIFAHELAHVAVGEEEGHGEQWNFQFDRLCEEYERIGTEMFGGEKE